MVIIVINGNTIGTSALTLAHKCASQATSVAGTVFCASFALAFDDLHQVIWGWGNPHLCG